MTRQAVDTSEAATRAAIARALTPAQQAELKHLSQPGHTAWPTIALFAVIVVAYIGADVLALAGVLPLGVAMAVIVACGYFAFSVFHDSIHRAISPNQLLNDTLGRVMLALSLPYATLATFRFMHIQHHRHANGAQDPDRVFDGPAWSLPLRWMFIDVLYLQQILRSRDPAMRRLLRPALRVAGVAIALMLLVIAAGYGHELLMLWFIPSRLFMLLNGFAFFWLPHLPHDTEQAANFTRATTVRTGYAPLLDVLLQFQNYHLLHHLHPTTPFYNNGRAWRLLEPALRAHDLAIQEGFALRPTLHAGTQRAALGLAPACAAAAARAPRHA